MMDDLDLPGAGKIRATGFGSKLVSNNIQITAGEIPLSQNSLRSQPAATGGSGRGILSNQTQQTFKAARPQVVDTDTARYLKSSMFSTYDRVEGKIAIPVMGPSGTAPVVVRVHAPIGFRDVEFEMIKEGMPPVFPAMADTASGDTILSGSVEIPKPFLLQNGGLRYGIKGNYSYVQPAGGRATEDVFQTGRNPYYSTLDFVELYPDAPSGVLEGQEWSWNQDGIDARTFGSYRMIL
jgi:hypothetical protein